MRPKYSKYECNEILDETHETIPGPVALLPSEIAHGATAGTYAPEQA